MSHAPHAHDARRTSRRRSRGAAMVEGIVVISVMLGFLGLIVWTRQAYGAKLDLQQKTRSEVLYNASHACQGGGGGESGTVGSPAPGGANGPSDGAATLTTKWNSASGSANTTVSFTSIMDNNAGTGNGSISYGKRSLVSQVSASSTCICNEKKYNSQLTAWLSFGIDLVKSGGGISWGL